MAMLKKKKKFSGSFKSHHRISFLKTQSKTRKTFSRLQSKNKNKHTVSNVIVKQCRDLKQSLAGYSFNYNDLINNCTIITVGN